jgi:translin
LIRLDELGERLRGAFDAKNGAREAALSLSRLIIRTAANSIRAAHRGEYPTAAELLAGAGDAVVEMRARLEGFADIYGAGYVHDCQKEYAEAAIFLALVSGGEIPTPETLRVEDAAYLNGMGETVGELRRHTLDTMRRGELGRAEALLAQMDDIYYLLATFDYPDALTGGLRRTTDSVRGIIEKTRGELTTALRQQELREVLDQTMRTFQANGGHGG